MTRVTPGNEDLTAGLVDYFGQFIPRPKGARTSDDIRRGGRPKGTYGAVSGDIPITQYPEGVRTRVGGGNAGQAQSVDEKGDAYIPPTEPPTSPVPTPAPSPAPSPRSTPAPDGSGATGTNTGFSPFKLDLDSQNAALAAVGVRPMADVNTFFSEQLPVSASEKPVGPGESVAMDDDAFSLAIQRPENDKYRQGFDWSKDSSVAALRSHAKQLGFDDEVVVEGISTAGQKEKPFESSVGTADNNRALSVPGEKQAARPKKIRGAVDDRFAEGAEYGESYATDYSPLRTAQRNAFLDHDGDSLGASMAANSAIGRATRGGKTYFNDGGTLREVTREAYDALGNDKLDAEGLKNAYVSGIKSTLVPADTPDVVESPGESAIQAGDAYDAPDSDDSGDDYQTMGYSAEDAAQLASGGVIATTIDGDDMKSNYFNKGQDIEFEYNNTPPRG